jgi:hypothetical protein
MPFWKPYLRLMSVWTRHMLPRLSGPRPGCHSHGIGAADQSQGCRRDYRQRVEGHALSDGRLDGHIFEKEHTFGIGHTLQKDHRLEKLVMYPTHRSMALE